MDPQKPGLLPEFEGRAAPPELGAAQAGARVTVTLDIDADVLDWLKAQPLDWQREINNLARFYMETSNPPVPPPHESGRFTCGDMMKAKQQVLCATRREPIDSAAPGTHRG